MDLVVLSVALRLALGAGARTVAYRLLLAGLVAMLIGDAVYGLQSLNDTFSESGISNGVVMMSYVLLGAAALHPSMRLLDRRAPVTDPVTSRMRLAALTGAVLLPLVILLVEHLRGRSGHLSAIAVCGVALVVLLVLRLAGLARAQRRFAITDGLTGAYAREFLAGGLQLECQRAQHTQRPLAVVSLDVDHFKLLNDTYGHPAGDRVLCELTQRVRNGLEPGDVLARVGGDEFVVVVPNANAQWVGQLAEWVRDVVSATYMEVDGDVRVRVTVSLGIASFPVDGATAQALLQAADQARQAAKWAGRNRTFSSRGPVRSA
jgi:two-component system cell cycle response regulator